MYRDSLENLRKDILPTKEASIFADEERMRERISQVYVQVLSYEGLPNNFLYKRIEGLKKEVGNLADRHDKINIKQLDPLNKKLSAAGLENIKIKEKEIKP